MSSLEHTFRVLEAPNTGHGGGSCENPQSEETQVESNQDSGRCSSRDELVRLFEENIKDQITKLEEMRDMLPETLTADVILRIGESAGYIMGLSQALRLIKQHTCHD